LTCHRSKPLKRCSSIGGGGGHAGGAVAAAVGVFLILFFKNSLPSVSLALSKNVSRVLDKKHSAKIALPSLPSLSGVHRV